LSRRLKPGERIVSYQRETLEGLGREIVRARILDESSQRITETIYGARGAEALDYHTLRERDRQALRNRHGAGGPGFDTRMDSRPATALPFTVQFMPGTSADAAAREIAQLGAIIESRSGSMAAIRALPAVARKIARLPSV
jgi:hypothetical protein